VNLTWQKTTCPIFGAAYELVGLPLGMSASARRSGKAGRYVAHGFIGGCYLNQQAGTLRAAMSRLQSEIDRRSIGLLGVDDVAFEVQI
jgi:hypothetical protein